MSSPVSTSTAGAASPASGVLIFASSESAQALTASSFSNEAGQINLTEIALGKIALERSRNAEVRGFAERMIKDHTQANDELTAIARGTNAQVPAQLDAKHQELVDVMKARSHDDFDFDAQYARHMADGHSKAVALFTTASQSKSLDHEFSTYATETLPTLREHRRMADQLVARRATMKGPPASNPS